MTNLCIIRWNDSVHSSVIYLPDGQKVDDELVEELRSLPEFLDAALNQYWTGEHVMVEVNKWYDDASIQMAADMAVDRMRIRRGEPATYSGNSDYRPPLPRNFS